jgi:hypothetical protein
MLYEIVACIVAIYLASIVAALYSMALSREKSRTSTGGRQDCFWNWLDIVSENLKIPFQANPAP